MEVCEKVSNVEICVDLTYLETHLPNTNELRTVARLFARWLALDAEEVLRFQTEFLGATPKETKIVYIVGRPVEQHLVHAPQLSWLPLAVTGKTLYCVLQPMAYGAEPETCLLYPFLDRWLRSACRDIEEEVVKSAEIAMSKFPDFKNVETILANALADVGIAKSALLEACVESGSEHCLAVSEFNEYVLTKFEQRAGEYVMYMYRSFRADLFKLSNDLYRYINVTNLLNVV